jgi:hypothetical protein
MHWILMHSSKIVGFFVALMGILTSFIGFTVNRQRKKGESPHINRVVAALAFVMIAIACTLFGIILVRNYG